MTWLDTQVDYPHLMRLEQWFVYGGGIRWLRTAFSRSISAPRYRPLPRPPTPANARFCSSESFKAGNAFFPLLDGGGRKPMATRYARYSPMVVSVTPGGS